MRAVTVRQFGQSPQVEELATPVAGPGQVLIKLAAASVNPMDAKLASGEWRPAPVIFPMVLGVDGAGIIEAVGEGVTRFSPGDRVFGQLFIPPVGSSGTYADFVAVTSDAPLALVPGGLDLMRAAAAPTAGTTGLSLIDLLEPAEGQIVLIVGAGGGVGTFATQFAVNEGASVIANVNAGAEDRVRAYGVEEVIVRSSAPVTEVIHSLYPDGIDVLIDLVGSERAFASAASLVRPGGTAISTQYVADLEGLQAKGVRGRNFALRQSTELLERVAEALVDRTVTEPPLTQVSLEDVPAIFGSHASLAPDGKIVIVL
jgi:NADPH:quinone reductase-like Zn-dependent oxidoreductase